MRLCGYKENGRKTMVTKELLISEIEKLDEKYFDEIYEIVKKLAKPKPIAKKKKIDKNIPILLQLQSIATFEGPGDLSINHDLYVTGEKTLE
jgi:hypothetical protein